MGLLDRIPARIWISLFVLGAGAGVAVVAVDKLAGMQSLMKETSIATDGGAEARYVPPSDEHPTMARAAELVLGMPGLQGIDLVRVEAVVASISDGVARSDDAAARRGMQALEGLAAFNALSCQIKAQFQGGEIKSVRLTDGTHRLPFECRDGEGRMFYPTVTSLMPVVDDAGLAEVKTLRNGVIGSKSSGSMAVSWVIPVKNPQ